VTKGSTGNLETTGTNYPAGIRDPDALFAQLRRILNALSWH
jgi:hypothetical protein